jgi:inner membrane protein YidH
VTEQDKADPRASMAGTRTSLATFRTALALDRTTLAWVRTALTFATFGFGMIGFFRALEAATHSAEAARFHQAAVSMGEGLVVIGLVATLLAAGSHWMALRRLRRGDQLSVARVPLSVAVAVLIALLGLYALWPFLTP